jgi:hypothetical protein
MRNVEPSPAAVGGRFDPVTSPTGPLDKRSNAAPVSQIVPNGDPISEVRSVPENTNSPDPNRDLYQSSKPKPVAEGGVY